LELLSTKIDLTYVNWAQDQRHYLLFDSILVGKGVLFSGHYVADSELLIEPPHDHELALIGQQDPTGLFDSFSILP
jgi:hypothetical protein